MLPRLNATKCFKRKAPDNATQKQWTNLMAQLSLDNKAFQVTASVVKEVAIAAKTECDQMDEELLVVRRDLAQHNA